jgi:hypothetical protein
MDTVAGRPSPTMRYPCLPLPERNPVHRPHGSRIARIVTINPEVLDLLKHPGRPYHAGGPAIRPDMLPGNIPDFPNCTCREHGQRMDGDRPFMIETPKGRIAGLPSSIDIHGFKLLQHCVREEVAESCGAQHETQIPAPQAS